jgi:crossover junction endodeoxyribonuclease RusA
MEIVEICLPWPSSTMSPNSRVHWSTRWKHVRQYRFLAACIVRKHYPTPPSWVSRPMRVTTTFYAPSRRRQDVDNMQARMKAAYDGIADALCIDDSLFVSTSQEMDLDPDRQGFVGILIRPK